MYAHEWELLLLKLKPEKGGRLPPAWEDLPRELDTLPLDSNCGKDVIMLLRAAGRFARKAGEAMRCYSDETLNMAHDAALIFVCG